MAACLIFVFAALIEFAYVNVHSRVEKRRRRESTVRLQRDTSSSAVLSQDNGSDVSYVRFLVTVIHTIMLKDLCMTIFPSQISKYVFVYSNNNISRYMYCLQITNELLVVFCVLVGYTFLLKR